MGYVISDAAEPEAVAERYMRHSVVDAAEEAGLLKTHHERLGWDPMDPDELSELPAERDRLVEGYGNAYRGPYGWATGLVRGRLTFKALEEHAGLDHLRPLYAWASKPVHASARGASLNEVIRGHQTYLVAGPTNFLLPEPAVGALMSLMQVTVTLLRDALPGGSDDEDWVAVGALDSLVRQTEDAFISAQQDLEHREAKYQAARTDESAP